MTVIGFNYTKLNVERRSAKPGKVTVANNISLSKVEEQKLAVGAGSSKTLSISFLYELKYTPEIAYIVIEGTMLLLLDEKVIAENLKQWKEKKSLETKTFEQVMGTIFSRCQVQSIVMARDLNLPSPVPLPKIKMNVPAKPEVASPKKK